ncbi:hypothetical protein BH11PLA1_BH11PLA1_20970 [soil metagenome]
MRTLLYRLTRSVCRAVSRSACVPALAAAATLLAGGATLSAAPVSWTGLGDGTSWSQAANWSSTPALPGAADDVTIPAGATAVNSSTSVAIRTLTLARTLNQNSGTLTITAGDLALTAPAILQVGSAGFGANLVFSRGSPQGITGSGEVRVSPNGSLSVLTSGTVLTIAPGVTAGANALAGSGSISIATGATLINQGTIISTGSTHTLNVTIAAAGQLTNTGTISSQAGATLNLNTGPFTNNGTFAIGQDADLVLAGTYTALGTITRSGNGGTLTLRGTFSPAAPVNLNATTGSVVLNGVVNNATFNATGGAVVLASTSTINSSTFAAPLQINSGTVTVGGNLTIAPGGSVQVGSAGFTATLQFNSGAAQSILGNGTVSITPNGFVAVTGAGTTLTIASGITVGTGVAGSGSINIGAGATVTNQGTILATGVGRTFNIVISASPGTSLSSSGTISAQDSATLAISGGAWSTTGILAVGDNATLNLGGTFSSLGTIVRTGNGGTLRLQGTFTPAGGTFTASAATGPINLGGTIADTTLNATDGQVFISTGSALDNVTLNAAFNQTQGTLTIVNNLTLGAAGAIQVGSAGFTATMNFSGGGPRALTGSGTITITPNGNFTASGAGTVLTIAPGITITSGVAGSGQVIAQTGAAINSQGTIISTGAGRTLTVTTTGAGSTFTNFGTVSVQNSAALNVSGSWTNSGTFAVGTNADLNLNGTYTTLGTLARSGTGGTVNLSGTFNPAGGLFTVNAATGPINLVGVTINNATLNAQDGQVLTSTSATLNNITLNANFTQGSGNLAVSSGNLTLGAGVILQVGSSGFTATLLFNGGVAQSLLGSGTLNLSPNGNLSVTGAATALTIGPAVTVSVSTAVSGAISNSSGQPLLNQGTIIATGAGRSLAISSPGVGSSFVNQGIVSSQGGAAVTISSGAWTNPGTFAVGSGSTLTLNGTYSAVGTITRSGTGGTVLLGGTFNPAGGIFNVSGLTGPLVFSGGSVNNATLGAANGEILRASSTTFNNITLAAPLSMTSGTVSVASGNLTLLTGSSISIGATGFSVALSFTAGSPQTLAGTGEVTVTPNGNINAINTPLTIGSNIVVTSNVAGNGTVFATGTGSIQNQGTIRASGAGAQISVSAAGAASFSNVGTVAADLGATLNLSGNITNYVSVTNTLMGGAWLAGPSSTISWSATPAFTVRTIAPNTTVGLTGPGATFNGFSTLNSVQGAFQLAGQTFNLTPQGIVLNNSGTVRLDPGALLNITGGYTQAPTGTLAIGFAGLTNAQFGRLITSGVATVNGTVATNVVAPFTPLNTDTFIVVTGSSRAGTFSAGLGDGQYTPSATYTATQVSLKLLSCISILNQPISSNVCPGVPNSFTVATVPAIADNYQWQIETTPGIWANLANGPRPFGNGILTISGVNTATLTVTSTVTVSTAPARFRLILTQACGSISSNVAQLTFLGTKCQPADIANDAGNALPPQGNCTIDPNNGVNEGDYNLFFNTFFTNQAIGSPSDIADDQGTPLPPFGNGGQAPAVNSGVNEGDYNAFFNSFFNGCPA